MGIIIDIANCGVSRIGRACDIVIDLARLWAATGAPDEAKRLAEDGLAIRERCEYMLQGADVHLEFAKLALAKDDKAPAAGKERLRRSPPSADRSQ